MRKPITTLIAMLSLLANLPAAAFDLQGHRGARGLAPENTLPAFAAALSLGVSTLEMDIAITRDGVLVISHDPVLNPDLVRGPDGQYVAPHGPAIRTLGFDELQRLDVGRIKPGSRYAAQFPDQQAIDGTRMPRLADVFALVNKAGNRAVNFDIETKVSPLAPDDTIAPEPFARALIAAIREAGMASRSQIQSFDWRTLQVVQQEAPEIRTVYLSAQQRWLDNVGSTSAQVSPWTAGFKYADHGSVPKLIHAAGGRIWGVHFNDLNAESLKEAKALGITVMPWTVNEPAHIARMLDLGVDGIISDRPDRVRAEMQRRGMALPDATPVTP